ncbi:MAG: FG-GAP-like repeat-containing protein [Planctomycetaceae bacterium]
MTSSFSLSRFGIRPRTLVAAASALVIVVVLWLLRPWDAPAPTSEKLFAEALAAIERDDVATAQARLDLLLQRDPDHGEARLYRGQLLSERGETDAALGDWRTVPDVPMRFGSTARYLEGTLLLGMNQAREAERLLRRASALNPAYLQPRERLLELFVAQRRAGKIRDTLAAIRKTRPWRLEECALQVLATQSILPATSGLKQLEACAAADPEDWESRLALCRYRLDSGDVATALPLLRKLLTVESTGPRAAGLLIAAELERGRTAEAERLLTEWKPQDDAPAELWHAAGEHAASVGDWSRAADCFGQASRLDPYDVAACHAWGTALVRLDDPEAERVLRTGVRLDLIERKADLILGGLQRNPELLAATAIEIGDEFAHLERHVDAAQWFEQAVTLSPGNRQALAGLQQARQSLQHAEPSRQAAGAVADVPAASSPTRSGSRNAMVQTTLEDRRPSIGVTFRDVAARAGIDFRFVNGRSGFKYLIETVGGGVAVIDYDSDGWPDLYFPQGGFLGKTEMPPPLTDELSRSRGDGSYERVSALAGVENAAYSFGAAVGDYDGDGFPDLVVANFGRNTFYRNNGDGTFADVTDEVGLHDEAASSSAAFADFDGDGLLDLYVANYVSDPLRICRNRNGEVATCDPQNFEGKQDRLYRNRGDGSFEDVTDASGIVVPDGKGLGVVAADLDADGKCDVYVANDGTPNFLFRNVSSGPGELRFVESGLRSGTATNGEGRSEAGMGIACDDFDGDGRPDLYVTNFYGETNTLYLNRGEGLFVDATGASGHVGPTRNVLGFGTQSADIDLDGVPDLVVANGDIDDYRALGRPWQMRPLVFAGTGGGRFVEVGDQCGSYFNGKYVGRGMARLDWNRDGRPDLVIVHLDRPAALLTNEADSTNEAAARPGSLVLELRGVASNRDAVGAVVRVTAGGRTQTTAVCGGHGYCAANELRLFFGLGSATRIERVEVDWPSGIRQAETDLPIDSAWLWVEGRQPHPLTPQVESGGPATVGL